MWAFTPGRCRGRDGWAGSMAGFRGICLVGGARGGAEGGAVICWQGVDAGAGKRVRLMGAGRGGIARSYAEGGYGAWRMLRIPYGTDESRFGFYDRSSRKQTALKIACVGVIGIRKGLQRLLWLGEWAQTNK